MKSTFTTAKNNQWHAAGTYNERFLVDVETNIGLKRAMSKGQHKQVAPGDYVYNVSTKEQRGPYSMTKGVAREMLVDLCMADARSFAASLYESHEWEPMVERLTHVLFVRLTNMQQYECPRAIFNLWKFAVAQHDFCSNERTGETLRNNKKSANRLAERRANGVKARNFSKKKATASEVVKSKDFLSEDDWDALSSAKGSKQVFSDLVDLSDDYMDTEVSL